MRAEARWLPVGAVPVTVQGNGRPSLGRAGRRQRPAALTAGRLGVGVFASFMVPASVVGAMTVQVNEHDPVLPEVSVAVTVPGRSQPSSVCR